MSNRNINERDREIDRENLEKARESKGKKASDGRNITEHDREADRENLEKARKAREERNRKS